MLISYSEVYVCGDSSSSASEGFWWEATAFQTHRFDYRQKTSFPVKLLNPLMSIPPIVKTMLYESFFCLIHQGCTVSDFMGTHLCAPVFSQKLS